MFKRDYTPDERDLFRSLDDEQRALLAWHETTHLQVEAQSLKRAEDWRDEAHNYMLAQIAIEAMHDAVLISRADFERLCANHAVPPACVTPGLINRS